MCKGVFIQILSQLSHLLIMFYCQAHKAELDRYDVGRTDEQSKDMQDTDRTDTDRTDRTESARTAWGEEDTVIAGEGKSNIPQTTEDLGRGRQLQSWLNI